MLRFIRFVYPQDINPSWVELARPIPEEGDGPYIEYFKCPVRFECDQIKIAMRSSVMDIPLPGASPELFVVGMESLRENTGKPETFTRNRFKSLLRGMIFSHGQQSIEKPYAYRE
jgi:hypothetical protein